MIRGMKAIEVFWDDVMKIGVKEVVLTTVELLGRGDTKHELEISTLTRARVLGHNTFV